MNEDANIVNQGFGDDSDVEGGDSGSTLKNGVMYVFVANVINLVISLFTAFVLPKLLSVETYADIRLFTLYVNYLGILHLGYSDGMYLRNGGKSVHTIDKKEAKKEFNTFKIFQLFVSILMIGVSLIVGNRILLMCSLVIIPVGVSNYVRSLYSAIGEFKKYSRYTNINTLMLFAVNFILLFAVKTDYYLCYVVGYVIAYFLYWIFIEYELRKVLDSPKHSSRFEKRYLKENIGSGIFLMTGNFCNVIFTSIDRLFVQNLIGMIEFAYYSFAVSVETFLNIFITPISTTMYNYFCKDPGKDRVTMIKKYCLILAAVIAIFVFPVKFIVEHWIPKYNQSLGVLFFLITAQCVAILVKVVHVNLYKSRKQQKKYFAIMLCVIGASAVFDVIGYLIFHDMVAIAVATLITNVLWFIIGEIDLREYKLRIRDYAFFIFNMTVFLICGLCLDAIAGLVCYCGFVIVSSFVFEMDASRRLLEELRKYARKIKRKMMRRN